MTFPLFLVQCQPAFYRFQYSHKFTLKFSHITLTAWQWPSLCASVSLAAGLKSLKINSSPTANVAVVHQVSLNLGGQLEEKIQHFYVSRPSKSQSVQLKYLLHTGPNVLESMSFLSIKHFQSDDAELNIQAAPGIQSFIKDFRFLKVLCLNFYSGNKEPKIRKEKPSSNSWTIYWRCCMKWSL